MRNNLLSALIDFNSIKVRLEHSDNVEAVEELKNFNSIKVRLEHGATFRYFAVPD